MTYCERCERQFGSLYQHKAKSSRHNICHDCSKDFSTEYGLHEHYRQSSRHHYCSSCKRNFRSENNLQNHLKSSIHRPKDDNCPFWCGMKFVSRSALVLHLEAGKCRSGVDRATINRVVRQYDTNNIITDPRLLTSGTASDNTKYYASDRSGNGEGYECYLCHRSFSSWAALNQHLGSPAHQDKIYICLASTCRARFTTLSGLCQHIESEKCGVSKVKAVQDTMDGVLRQIGRLTF